MEVFLSLCLPFVGTAIGAAGVFFLGGQGLTRLQRALGGFAAGVMVAASVWSLLIPAIEQSEGLGCFAFLPAFAGVWAGILFLLILDRLLPRLREGSLGENTMMVFAVALHNLPEGMAVGVAIAGLQMGLSGITAASVLTLATGIALQNLPEGAIISLPLRAGGMGRFGAFSYGVLSGVVELMGAVGTMYLASLVSPLLPFFLAFSAGAMLFVVVQELLPQDEEKNLATLFFTAGFTLMLALDVALG